MSGPGPPGGGPVTAIPRRRGRLLPERPRRAPGFDFLADVRAGFSADSASPRFRLPESSPNGVNALRIHLLPHGGPGLGLDFLDFFADEMSARLNRSRLIRPAKI